MMRRMARRRRLRSADAQAARMATGDGAGHASLTVSVDEVAGNRVRMVRGETWEVTAAGGRAVTDATMTVCQAASPAPPMGPQARTDDASAVCGGSSVEKWRGTGDLGSVQSNGRHGAPCHRPRARGYLHFRARPCDDLEEKGKYMYCTVSYREGIAVRISSTTANLAHIPG